MPDKTWSAWLLDQMGERNWDRPELIRQSNGAIDSGQLSRWINNGARPKEESVRLVCQALKVPPVEGLIAAGYVSDTEIQGGIAPRPPRSARQLSDDELLEELGRRLRLVRQNGSEGWTIDYYNDTTGTRNETDRATEGG